MTIPFGVVGCETKRAARAYVKPNAGRGRAAELEI
jgi:hypothetical protein